MFASLKEKFFNVQEEITTSLRNLKFDRTESKRKSEQGNCCNYDAGLELLERYQSYWNDIHGKTEIVAMCAVEVDEIVESLHENYERQSEKVNKLLTALALIPQVIHGVQEVCDTILNLQCAFDETEDALLMLENMIETGEIRERQLEQRFQLVCYQEKRLLELEQFKGQLTEEHLQKIREFEEKQAPSLKERQAQFQEAFNKDLQQYKSQGSFLPKPTKSSTESTPSLEEIQLDEDPSELESFLEDDNDPLDQDQPEVVLDNPLDSDKEASPDG